MPFIRDLGVFLNRTYLGPAEAHQLLVPLSDHIQVEQQFPDFAAQVSSDHEPEAVSSSPAHPYSTRLHGKQAGMTTLRHSG